MNLPDNQIKNYLDWMRRDFEQIQSSSRRAVLINIRTYAVGLIRVIDFCLGREVSLNIDELQVNERENFTLNSSSQSFEREYFHAQNIEIKALNGFCLCGKSLEGLRKGTKFCSKKCNNLSRKS